MSWLRGDPLAKVLVGVLVVAGVVLITIFLVERAAREREVERALIAQVSRLAGDCEGAALIPSERKILVWDTAENKMSAVQSRLSDTVQGSASDPLLTIVMVLPERREQVGTYSVSNAPAYRVYVDVCVVLWPERRTVGQASAVSEEPPSSRVVQDGPEYGDPTEHLAELIESLRP